MERNFAVARCGHIGQVGVPAGAYIHAGLVGRLTQQQIECAFHVRRGEWLAVMPSYAVPKFEGQRSLIRAPSPLFG